MNKNIFDQFQHLKTINALDPKVLTELFEEVLGMNIESDIQLDLFFEKYDFIEKHCTNEWCEAYFLKSSFTNDEELEAKYLQIENDIMPIYKKYKDKVGAKFLASEFAKTKTGKYEIVRKIFSAEGARFNQKNIEIEKEINAIANNSLKELSLGTVKYQENEYSLSQLSDFYENLNPKIRKEVFHLEQEVRKNIGSKIDDDFDRLIQLRLKVAQNAGFESYIDYRFNELKRYEWTKEDCFKYHNAIKKHFVPLYEKICKIKAKNLGLAKLTPADVSVDFHNREPFCVYEGEDVGKLIEAAQAICTAVDSELSGFFHKLTSNKMLDVASRKNKASGGFMLSYPIFELAGLFGNMQGNASSLITTLHEAGHCFHYFLSKNVSPFLLQDMNSEVAEIGSMSMECFGLEEAHTYFGADEAFRLKEDRLLTSVMLLVKIAVVDEFQFWIYNNPNHTKIERQNKWCQLHSEYFPAIDYTDYMDYLKYSWQFSHIILLPFYYIDYGISEIQALNMWAQYKKDKKIAIANYKKGCALAGSASVKDTFEAFGSKLAFDESVLEPLAKLLERELKL